MEYTAQVRARRPAAAFVAAMVLVAGWGLWSESKGDATDKAELFACEVANGAGQCVKSAGGNWVERGALP